MLIKGAYQKSELAMQTSYFENIYKINSSFSTKFLLNPCMLFNNYSSSPIGPSASWTIDSEAMGMRGIIVLVKSNQLVKNVEAKQLQLAKRDSAAIVLVFKAGTFRYQWAAYNIQPSSSSTNQNAALIIDHQLDFTYQEQTDLPE